MTKQEKPNTQQPADLTALIATYGADLARWPKQLRGKLGDLSKSERTVMRQERALDQLLDQAAQPALPTGAKQRLLARLHDAPNIDDAPLGVAPNMAPPTSFLSYAWPGFSICTMAMVIGLYLGASGSIDQLIPSLSAPNTELALVTDDSLMSDFLDWQYGEL